jgi:hypothetical protein
MPTYERLEAEYLLVFFCALQSVFRVACSTEPRAASASDAERRVLG